MKQSNYFWFNSVDVRDESYRILGGCCWPVNVIVSTLLMIYRGGLYSLLDSLHLALQLHKPFKTLDGLFYKDLISFLDHVFQWTFSFDLQQVYVLLQLFPERFYFFYSNSKLNQPQTCTNLQKKTKVSYAIPPQTSISEHRAAQETKTTVNIYQHFYLDAIKRKSNLSPTPTNLLHNRKSHNTALPV